MWKTKGLTLVLLIVFQFALIFVANRFFVHDMREDIQTMGQELNASGMSPEQVRAITSNLSMIRINVSSYVNMVATFLIVANSLFMYGIIRKYSRDELSQ
jgi:hypothetical protein